MTNNSQCNGDTLPLGIDEPSDAEIEHAKRTMRHAFIAAPKATGTIYGVPVSLLSETDKALAFDWLCQRYNQAIIAEAFGGSIVRPV